MADRVEGGRTPVDLLVSAALVVTMDGRGTVLEDGAVAIRGADIAAVGPRAEVAGRHAPARTLATDGLLIPGW
jgi:5-methylthioadenosine/S-adenosylhomocysteine deaminase